MINREVQNVYQIAICDDEQVELNKTAMMLGDYKMKRSGGHHAGSDFVVECFINSSQMLRRIREEDYSPDLVLMDIYMQGMTGIEAARALREMHNESKIIFLTSSREHALDAFRVNATQYLTKPVSEEELYKLLDSLLVQNAEGQRKYVVLQADKKICRVAVQDIVYCEAQRKNQHIYLADGTQMCLHMSMAGLEELLSGFSEIVRAGNSYIINLRHIESLNGQELKMDTDRTLYVPRASYQSLRAQYFNYYTEETT